MILATVKHARRKRRNENMRLTNKRKDVIAKFEEKMKENGVDAYRVFIEFSYGHYDDFSKYVTAVVNGDIDPYF